METKTKILIGIGIIAIAVVFLAAINPQITGQFGLQSREKYKIGVILPSTGQFSNYYEKIVPAIELAVKNNQNIELIYEDDAGEPQKAALAATKLITINKVNALLSFRSSPSSAVAPIAEENKVILMYGSSLTKPAEDHNYVYMNYGNIQQDCATLATILKGEKGALIGRNVDSTIKCIEEFKKQGINLQTELFNTDAKDFRAQITNLKETKPSFLIIRGDELITQEIMKQIKELGFSGYKIICPQITGGGCNSQELMKNYPELLLNAIGTNNYLTQTTQLNEFREQYKTKTGKEPIDFSYAFYEDTQILSRVINECRGETNCMQNKLSTETFNGLEGPMKFNTKRIIERPTNIVVFDGNEWVLAN
jgi:branched-chain amino acid transport system substrate-binding protein